MLGGGTRTHACLAPPEPTTPPAPFLLQPSSHLTSPVSPGDESQGNKMHCLIVVVRCLPRVPMRTTGTMCANATPVRSFSIYHFRGPPTAVRFSLASSNCLATCKTRGFIDAQACLAKHRSQPTTLKNLPRPRARRPAQGRLITDTSTACWPSWPSSAASPYVRCHLPIESIYRPAQAVSCMCL